MTPEVKAAAIRAAQHMRATIRSADLDYILRAAFREAEIQEIMAPTGVAKVTVWLNGPDGPEAMALEVGGPAVPHGARVDSIRAETFRG